MFSKSKLVNHVLLAQYDRKSYTLIKKNNFFIWKDNQDTSSIFRSKYKTVKTS